MTIEDTLTVRRFYESNFTQEEIQDIKLQAVRFCEVYEMTLIRNYRAKLRKQEETFRKRYKEE